MKKIVTLTVNPALDKSITVPELVPDKKLRASEGKTEPGGGGVNISRALKHLGAESEAVYFSGGYTGRQFDALLEKEGVQAKPFFIQEDTRENFIVVNKASGDQYRFGMEGPGVSASEVESCLAYLRGKQMDYLAVSGSMAPGIPAAIMVDLSAIAKECTAKLVVDTSGAALAKAVEAGVYLLKPNLGELAMLTGRDRMAPGEVPAAARSIIQKGGCSLMVVSMGADGAVMVSADEQFHAKAPVVEKKSTVGAGDSMVAGILFALAGDWPLRDVLRYGVACGTAATMNEGTALCKKTDADALFHQVIIQ